MLPIVQTGITLEDVYKLVGSAEGGDQYDRWMMSVAGDEITTQDLRMRNYDALLVIGDLFK